VTAGARPLPRRALLRRAGSPSPTRATRQATAARSRHAPRRRQRRDGRRPAGGDGVCRNHRSADVRRVVRLMRNLRAAITFLTRIPIPVSDAPLTAAVPWFPIVGGMIGLTVGLVAAGLLELVPALVAASVGVLLGVLLTGAFHEDGLADVADAFA